MAVNCKDFLSSYGTGDSEHNRELLEHARTCEACARDREALGLMREALTSLKISDDALDDSIHRAVMQRVRHDRAPGRPALWRALAATASAAAVLTAVIWLYMAWPSGKPVRDAAMSTDGDSSVQPIDIQLFRPSADTLNRSGDRVRFVMRGSDGREHSGEVDLSESVVDSMQPVAIPASMEGL